MKLAVNKRWVSNAGKGSGRMPSVAKRALFAKRGKTSVDCQVQEIKFLCQIPGYELEIDCTCSGFQEFFSFLCSWNKRKYDQWWEVKFVGEGIIDQVG